MIHDSSLTTVALLSAYTENPQRHYLDLLIPFVVYCLPDEIGSVIRFDAVSQKLESEFGIVGTPEKIIKAVIRRYVRTHPDAVSIDATGVFTMNRPKDNDEFNQRRRTIRSQMDEVANKLSSYIESYTGVKTVEDPKGLLIRFFESYGLTLVDNVEELVTVQSTNKEMFAVSKFILWASKNDLSLFASLVELTKGFLTYRAIYQIDSEEKTDAQSKLRNVACYLDCSLLISLLGYDTEESKAAVTNILTIIRKNGGTIRIFEHTVEEAKRLLLSYADSSNKLRFRLPGLKAKREPDTAIRAQAIKLEESIRQQGIPITEVADEKLAQYSDDLSTVRNFIYERHANSRKSDYDYRSIVGIVDLRNHSHPLLFEQCKAILITQDLRLAYGIQRLRINDSHEIAYAKIDSDIIALLWLQTFTACPDIPKDILLSNAAAAITLSEDVRQRAVELCDEWEKDGSMSPAMATIIRSDRLDEYLLAEATMNDPDSLTLDVATKLVREYFEPEFTAEKDRALAEERKRYSDELHKQKEDMQAAIQIERKASSDALAENELRHSKENQEKERERMIRQSHRIDELADSISTGITTALKWIIIVLIAIACGCLIVAQSKSIIATFKNGTKPEWLQWFVCFGLVLIGVYSIISPFLSGEKTIKRLLNKLRFCLYRRIRKCLEAMRAKLTGLDD